MPATDLDDQSLALNLSYVLHEPSDSRAVRQAARESRRFRRRRDSLLRSFNATTSDELERRLTISPTLQPILEHREPLDPIFTASVGLPDLLPTVIAGLYESDTEPIVRILEHLPESQSESDSLILFGYPTRFVRPDDSGRLTCGLVLMPDHNSLLLTGSADATLESGMHDLIRDFVDQWTPARPLWRQPLEAVEPAITMPGWKAGGE